MVGPVMTLDPATRKDRSQDPADAAAMANVRLQWMVAGLTLLVGAAGVYATLQGA
jgi:hypothetical protein